LILDHGGVPHRVLTLRGDVADNPEFPTIHDLDHTGLPFFRSRAFAELPGSPQTATAASSRGLFGLTVELQPEGIVGFPDLLFAHPHVDDLQLTLSLLLRGFALLCPTRAILRHDPERGDTPTATRHPWLPRLAAFSLQALCACLFTEAAFARVMDDRALSTEARLRALLALPSLPWVSVGMGRACAGPQTLRVLAFVVAHAQEGGPNDDVLQYYRRLGVQSVLSRDVLTVSKVRATGMRTLMARLREGRRRPPPRPGMNEWADIVGLVIELNSESIQQVLEAAVQPLTTVQQQIGVDLRDGSATWEGFMGVQAGGPQTEHEVRELFGSRTSFELERSRWVRGS
jgi:hypothetical protein